MSLIGKTVAVSTITAAQQASMLALMKKHYHNVSAADFAADLAEKNWVILLLDEAGCEIRGFSTQMLFEHQYQNESLLVLFSGDTIIEAAHWGSMVLPLAWGRLMLSIAAGHPGQKLYWMLISKGARTYRFLPVFFREYYPRCDAQTPAWEQGLMDSLGLWKFPQRYDSRKGIIRAGEHAQTLLDDYQLGDRPNKHIDFFHQRNSGYRQGDELLCITPFRTDNITPFILRELKKKPLGNALLKPAT